MSDEPVLTRVCVLRTWDFADWPPTSPEGFMAWWQSKTALIPKEFRAGAIITIGAEEVRHSNPDATIKISYFRPETPEEEERRVLNHRAELEKQEAQERAQFEKLKAKFEGSKGQGVS